MPERFPPHLADLLYAPPATREPAWQEFVAQYSRLILSVARSLGGPYDVVMDRYAFILDRLRRDECKRLRAYASDPRAKFTTWLVVVCRRLALDEYRSKYGRVRSGSEVIRIQTRRALTDTLASALELPETAAPERERPDFETESRELHERLNRCLRALAPQDRLLIKLRFEDELSASEIGRIVGAPTPFHVYRRIDRVLKELRTALAHTPAFAQMASSRPLHVK